MKWKRGEHLASDADGRTWFRCAEGGVSSAERTFFLQISASITDKRKKLLWPLSKGNDGFERIETL
jgi:hypothetical protein